MFNGKDLTGWKASGNASWTIDGDAIRSVSTNDDGYLVSDEVYSDFTFLVQFKMEKNGDGAVSFHTDPGGNKGGWAAIIDKSVSKTGAVRNRTNNAWVKLPVSGSAAFVKKDEWNDFHLRYINGQIWTWINGRELVHISGNVTPPTSGRVVLEVSKGDNSILWRDIQIRHEKP